MSDTQTKFNDATIIPPAAPRKVMGSIIWLHGLDMPSEDWEDLSFLSLKPRYYRLAMPKAPRRHVSYKGKEMSSWYDMDSKPSMTCKESLTQLEESIDYVKKIIAAEEKVVKAEDIIIGGHGQGASIALMAGLTYPKQLFGIVSASGYIPPHYLRSPELLKSSIKQTKELSVMWLHGAKDSEVDVEFAKRGNDVLVEMGMGSHFQIEDDAGHRITQTQLGQLGSYFGFF
eukprot:TRINITY_DN8867_c0_g1_i1.p1 TRINITY_DN8867_c0_g1~~TRINITY_DN8867_c0_g1_i1.p1  ORF type:complete len:247 (+),score=49.20 TRINITY_DN8867_c0_g1_i1:55-741(+)